MVESEFQSKLIIEIKERLPDSIVLKNDPGYIQGVPDLIVLHNNRWAALEVKKQKTSKARPNQKYYVDKMANMSFASFVFPENKEEVLNELERALRN